jgi:hypothetical protein
VTFLELCQEMVAQFGLSGGTGPSAVTGQKGELGNVVRWIRDACLDTDNKWQDWRYLWLPYAGTLATNTSTGTVPTQSGVKVRRWQTKALKYRTSNPLGTSWTPIGFMAYNEFIDSIDPDTASPGTPGCFTVLPDDTLQFDRPADQSYDLKGGFYRRPPKLAANSDVPLMPDEFHRIIIVRALKYYADREDAGELVNAAVSEYPDLLEKLESDQLENFRHRRVATSDEQHARHFTYGPRGIR